MKNLFLLLFVAISCKSFTQSNCSQYTIVPMTTFTEIPENQCYYMKDTNNELNDFEGTWKGTYNGRVYELKFNKNLYQDFTGHKRDRIKGRLRITTESPNGLQGLTIFDNFNEPDDEKTRFSGLGFQPDLKSYMMIFSGPFTKGCMNAGTVYLTVKPSAPNQMKIIYLSETDIVVGECPNTFEQTFPEKKTIILTKQ